MLGEKMGLCTDDDEGSDNLINVLETEDGPRIDFRSFCEWSSVPIQKLLDGELEEKTDFMGAMLSNMALRLPP